MTIGTPDPNGPDESPVSTPEGLGSERNQQIVKSLTAGDFQKLVHIIAEEPDKDKACEVVLRSMFDFHHVDRATDVQQLARVALKQSPEVMAALIRYSYHHNKTTERFWQDPNDSSRMLNLDRHGNIISHPMSIATVPKGLQGAGERFVRELRSYTVLTGPDKGKTFNNEGDRGIPIPEPNTRN